MYSVYYNNELIHYSISPMDELHLIDPELTMGDSVAGSLNFTMLTTNPGYNRVERMRGLITVKRDSAVIWTGRVITQSEDFWKRRTCTSEGALAFLNDTNQDMVTYKNTTMLTFLTKLLEVHNSKVPVNRQIYLGTVTVNDKNDSHQYQTNYKSTWEELQTNLLDRLGGHIRIRYDGSTPKLDYLASYPKAATQEINFGQNLLDFTKNWDLSNLVTVILPRGKQLDEEDANGQRDYVTVASVNGGDKFVKNQNAYNTYGRIEKNVDFSDVESPSQLLTLAQNYVSAQQFDDMSLSVSAIDLHTLTGSVLAFDLLDEVRCISRPHGMDTWFPVNEVKIPLEHPENTTYSMGASRPSPMSSKASENTQTFLQKLENYLSIATILEQAKANATEIMEMVTTGYVNIITENETSQAIIISNTPDVESATKLWKFNMNGLGYLDKTKSQDYQIAITMDGSIVADFVNTGRITDGNSYWDLTSGSLFISPLSSFGSNSKTVQDVVDVIDETITGVDVEYAQNQSPTVAPTSGWATTAPTWQNGYYIWQRTATTNALGTSYSTPTCISGVNGKDGLDGADGRGVTSIVEQYYLSTSGTSVTGGSWSSEQPNFANDKYIWTRSLITWDDGTTSTTTAVLAKALNSAYSTATTASANASSALTKANTAITDAANAAKVATNYLTFNSTNGLDVGYSGTQAKTRIKANGVEIFDSAGNSALFAGIENNKSIVRVGKASGSGNIMMSSDGYVDIRNASTILAHFGYGSGENFNGGTSVAPYYNVGVRKSGTTIGNYSVAEGQGTTAKGAYSHAEGYNTTANGTCSHTEGQGTTASAFGSHAEGGFTTASGQYSHAGGRYNIANASHIISYGVGAPNYNKDGLYVDYSGNMWIAGSLTQNSDRRLKEHHAYLGEDACEFVRKLKPALYTKDGERHVGFYAQDVQAAEPKEWNTDTVTAQHTDESLDFDPLTLEYTALIAPLVAYTQMLERRLDEQQSQIDALTKRMEALERR